MQKAYLGGQFLDGVYIYRAERLMDDTGSTDRWLVTPNRQKKTWTAKRCTITTQEGFATKVEVEGSTVRHSHSRNGVNANLQILSNPVKKGKRTFGDIERWSFIDGRLQSADTVAKDARIEGVA